MASSSNNNFGTASPLHKIKIENANGTSCASLAQEIEDAEAELDLFQEMLLNTNDKPSVIRLINKAMVRIHALNTQQVRLGC